MTEQFTKERFEEMQASDRYAAIHLVACGIGLAGWYFWNDYQTRAQGPYESEEQALAWEAYTRQHNPGWFTDEDRK